MSWAERIAPSTFHRGPATRTPTVVRFLASLSGGPCPVIPELRLWILAASFSALVAGCVSTPVARVPEAAAPVPIRSVLWTHFFFWGLLGHAEVDVRGLCGTRPSQSITLQTTTESLAASVLTLGIYIPRRMTIECDPGPRP